MRRAALQALGLVAFPRRLLFYPHRPLDDDGASSSGDDDDDEVEEGALLLSLLQPFVGSEGEAAEVLAQARRLAVVAPTAEEGPMTPPALVCSPVVAVDKCKLSILKTKTKQGRGDDDPQQPLRRCPPSAAGMTLEEEEGETPVPPPSPRRTPSLRSPSPSPRSPSQVRYLTTAELLPMVDAAAHAGDTYTFNMNDPSSKTINETPTPQQQLPRTLAALRAGTEASAAREEGYWMGTFRALDDVRRLAVHHPRLFSAREVKREREGGREGSVNGFG